MTVASASRQVLAPLGASVVLLVLATLAPWSTASSQEFEAERARVVQQIGDVKEDDINLFPLRDAPGLVFSQEITEPGAQYLRFYFEMAEPGVDWGLRVRDGNSVLWETSEDAATDPAFWSPEFDRDQLSIDVFSAKSDNALKLVLSRIVIGADKGTPESITEPNELTSINGQDAWIQELGRSVARLRIVGDFGGTFTCTAFLVTPEIMLTNQHCIASNAEAKSTKVDFDFDVPGPPGEVGELMELLDSSFELDYAVVRLKEASSRPPLELDVVRPDDDAQLLIIQHPGGQPKQISLADCSVDGVLVEGRGADMTDFGHQCDTLGGSSGSPVFDFADRKVVGLHHLGIDEGSNKLFNRAAHIELVLEDLDDDVRAEIEHGQP